MSAENLFNTRPVGYHVLYCNLYAYNIPTGLVSKNSIRARSIDLNILLCKLRAAARHIRNDSTARNITIDIALPTTPPYIPILWWVVRSKLLVLNDMFSICGEQEPSWLALSDKSSISDNTMRLYMYHFDSHQSALTTPPYNDNHVIRYTKCTTVYLCSDKYYYKNNCYHYISTFLNIL